MLLYVQNGENRFLRNVIAHLHTILRRVRKVGNLNAHNSEKFKSQNKVDGWLIELVQCRFNRSASSWAALNCRFPYRKFRYAHLLKKTLHIGCIKSCVYAKRSTALSSRHACVSVSLLFLVTSIVLNTPADRRIHSRDSNFDFVLFNQQNVLFKLQKIR